MQELIFVDTLGNVLGSGAPESTRFAYLGLGEYAGIRFGKKFFMEFATGPSVFYYL